MVEGHGLTVCQCRRCSRRGAWGKRSLVNMMSICEEERIRISWRKGEGYFLLSSFDCIERGGFLREIGSSNQLLPHVFEQPKSV